MKTKHAALLLAILTTSSLIATPTDTAPRSEPTKLVYGGRFMDLFLPMPLIGQRTENTWGVDAVKPRDILNGIEDPEWSYWGGKVIRGEDGLYHIYVARWREDSPKGHMAWKNSEVAHCVSNSLAGPYRYVDTLGEGHNPEIYQARDGRYVIGIIDGYYVSNSLNGPWELKKFKFDHPPQKTGMMWLHNLTFCRREDGSYLMINRTGETWISEDGISTWEQVSPASAYPGGKKSFEDPVVWRTPTQYHMVVNQFMERIAFHLRSKDGVRWVVDPGEAYLPGIAISEDGGSDDWHKYERMKVFQDEYGRAIQANFAVIDCVKIEDKPNDIHNSKNISIPLMPERLLTILNEQPITSTTREILVKIKAEPGFNPHTDIDFASLHFGAPESVDFGQGYQVTKTSKQGDDLIITFSGTDHGITPTAFVAKLLGKSPTGKLVYGYARLPGVEYLEPILSVRETTFKKTESGSKVDVRIKNYGQVPSSPVIVRLESESNQILTHGTVPALKPYETAIVTLDLNPTLLTGKKIKIRPEIDSPYACPVAQENMISLD